MLVRNDGLSTIAVKASQFTGEIHGIHYTVHEVEFHVKDNIVQQRPNNKVRV